MVKNLFKRMGYVRRLAVTGKVEVSGKLKAEIETVYFYGVVNKNQWTQNSIIYEYQPRPNSLEIYSLIQEDIGRKRK